MKPKIGRPSTYTQAVADEICERLANGENLKTICRDAHLPPPSTVIWWYMNNHQGFAEPYLRAREALMELMAEEIVAIADDTSQDTIIDEDGNRRQNSEWVNGRRLQVDARKWVMSKIVPKKWGDKQQVEHSGTVGFAQLVAEANAKDET